MTTRSPTEIVNAITFLRRFISPAQLNCMMDSCRGEEGEWFKERLCSLAAQIKAMPKTYDQDGLGENAIVTLHYFVGSSDWWITEQDKGGPDDDKDCPPQHQAFGFACVGGDWQCAELGYISIVELLSCGAELDLHFKPRTLGEVKAERELKPETEPATPAPTESGNKTTKPKRTPIPMTEVLEWLQANHPELHAVAEPERDWCWLVADLRGDHNKPIRESIKSFGFVYARNGGHLLPSGKLGNWAHHCMRPLPFFRKSKGKSTSHPTSETTTDQQPDAALAAALAFATAA